jgi:autotransporter-associated beta strand protein
VRFQLPSSLHGELRRCAAARSFGLALTVASLLTSASALAQSTWIGSIPGLYNSGINWTPTTAPVAAGQSAIFGAAGTIFVGVTAGPIAPDSWTFTAASQSYTITGADVNFSLPGASGGIISNATGQTISIANNIGESIAGVQVQQLGNGTLILSGTNTYSGGTTISAGTLQLGTLAAMGSIVGTVTNEGVFNVVNANTAGITSITNDGFFGGPALTTFLNATTAGTATIVNQFGGTTVFNDSSSAMNANITNVFTGGSTLFFNNSSAGNAIITNKSAAGSLPLFPVGLGFFDNSTAANATIVNSSGGLIAFGTPFSFGGFNPFDTPTAGNANITNNAGGHLQFDAFSTAGNAIITTNSGGAVRFFDNATGGNAQFITNGTGYVDFSGSAGPNNDGVITAGSIAGSGTYYIGPNNLLVVGSNNLSTEVSGIIADGCGCSPGSLEKVGTGTLTLSGTNTYTGATLVNGGTLLVTGSIASSTVVLVDNGATLGGTGTVAATLLNNGATLAPGLPTARPHECRAWFSCSRVCRSRRHGARKVSRQHVPVQLALHDPDRARRLWPDAI